jgi:hypothetical protein
MITIEQLFGVEESPANADASTGDTTEEDEDFAR